LDCWVLGFSDLYPGTPLLRHSSQKSLRYGLGYTLSESKD
jgi:hypothetical protein